MARRLSRDDIISNVYYNLETGFGSINETLKKAKEHFLRDIWEMSWESHGIFYSDHLIDGDPIIDD